MKQEKAEDSIISAIHSEPVFPKIGTMKFIATLIPSNVRDIAKPRVYTLDIVGSFDFFVILIINGYSKKCGNRGTDLSSPLKSNNS